MSNDTTVTSFIGTVIMSMFAIVGAYIVGLYGLRVMIELGRLKTKVKFWK